MNRQASLVIIVDDDISVRRGLGRLLESEGYAVETFASAAEYLLRPVPECPACLVLDVKMPGPSGLDLQQYLADHARDESIVFITGHGDVPMCAKAMKGGAVDFLLKPFNSETLLKVVAQALQRAKHRWASHAAGDGARALLARLSPREMEVFRLIITGMLNKQIAGQLGTAEKTVKNQRAQIIVKLGVNSVAEMVKLAHLAESAPVAEGNFEPES